MPSKLSRDRHRLFAHRFIEGYTNPNRIEYECAAGECAANLQSVHTDNIYISREISIEHPSVGLASLAQLFQPCLFTRKMVPITGRARSFILVFKNKMERRGRQNKNNRPINLPNVITFSTDFKYTTQS